MSIGSRYSAVTLVAASVALCALAAPRGASASWPECGRAVSSAAASQLHSAVATDGAGGAIITWQDSRNPRVNIFARRVLASGELDVAWPVDGQALLTDSVALTAAAGGQTSPAIVADGAGGAIVAWQDLRSDVTETDLFAQHVLAFGTVDRAWPANGTALVAIEGQQNTFAMVSDGAGGAIVAWMDDRPGASVTDIYAQRVLASGRVDARWPLNGLAVCTAPARQELPAIASDGAGGAIITWDDARSSVSGFDIFAQHVMSSGVVDPAWPVNGRALCTADSAQGRPTIVSDGVRGAIVAWSDARVVNTSHIFAHHVLGSGAVDPAWPVNGRAISDAGVAEARPLAISDGAGGAIVNWQAFTVQLNMYAQHVKATGVVDPAWPAGGRALGLTERQQVHGRIVPDGSGGAVVAWEENFDVFAQHVLASGALDPTYPDTGREVCSLPVQRGDPALVATGGGGAIVTWTDTRNGKDADIYAMQVLAVSTVDVPGRVVEEITFARPSPNPARGALTLRFALPRTSRVTLAIYDPSGRRVRELASGARPAGEQAIAWDLRDERGRAVGAGLYFARLEAEGRSITQKLVTLR